MHLYDVRRAFVWAAAHEVSGDGMASVGGSVAEVDRNNFGVVALARVNDKAACAPKGFARPVLRGSFDWKRFANRRGSFCELAQLRVMH
jgi:uncharacterized Zn-binding protein involved in type VI secretion